MKPSATNPALAPAQNAKTGTSVVKSAPPKETARITVKPSLPARVGNFAPPKPGDATVPVAAGAAAAASAPKPASKPATTIIKSGGATTARAVAKPGVAVARPVAATAATTVYQEEPSTTLTTALAAGLAILTWGTAGVLIASYMALF